jgi:hypothetical protein
MHQVHRYTSVLLAALVLAPGAAQACGENQFNMGQGLSYQKFLAPRPASILVFDEDAAEHKALYSGLARAGHKVSVVRTSEDASRATSARGFDVIIADLVDAERFAADASAEARVLPVVQREQRNQPGLRERFDPFVVDGASLGQYLKSIDRLVRLDRK